MDPVDANPYVAPSARLDSQTPESVGEASKWSRRLFAAEIFFIAVPLSLLYVTLGFPILFSLPDGLAQNWTRGLPALLAVIALAAVASGWVLIVSFMYTGRSGLRRRSVVWWLISLAGACVVGLALVSAFLVPQSPPYSDLWNVRASLNLFIAGAPLLLPLGHLFLESHWAA